MGLCQVLGLVCTVVIPVACVFVCVCVCRETNTYVLRGVDELQALLDEHTTLTQQMSFSVFKKSFAERIDTYAPCVVVRVCLFLTICVCGRWSETLNLASDVLDEWMKVQRAWLYLQPIFDTADIQKQVWDAANMCV